MLDNVADQSLLDRFLAIKSQRTQKAYLQDFSHLASFMDLPSAESGLMVLLAQGPDFTNELIGKYQHFLQEKGLSLSTINRKLAAIRAIFAYAREVGRIDWDLCLPNMRQSSKRDHNRLPAVRRLIASVDRTTSKGYRDFAILRLIFDLAMRRSDVVALDYPEHIDLKRGLLSLPNPRRNDPFFVELPKQTQIAISEWLAIRGSKRGPLFINYDPARKGDRLTGRSLDRNVVKPLTYLIGLHLSPDRLRTLGIEQALKLAKERSLKLEDVLASGTQKSSLLSSTKKEDYHEEEESSSTGI